MGGSDGVTRAAKTYFVIRIWSAPLALANYVVLGWLIGQARATLALSVQIAINVINMVATDAAGAGRRSRHRRRGDRRRDRGSRGPCHRRRDRAAADVAAIRRCRAPRLFERDKLMRMLAVNRDIMIRTASLIAAWLFFTAQGARSGDVILAANAVLNNFLLVSAFFLDGLANAAEQLCGRAYGARSREHFSGAVRLVLLWGFGFALAVAASFALFGPALIDVMTASADVRRVARDFLVFVIVSPVLGRVRLRLRRHLYRRDLGARHAQSDAGLAGDLPRRMVRAARLRQCRAVGRAAGALRRARRPAGAGAIRGC